MTVAEIQKSIDKIKELKNLAEEDLRQGKILADVGATPMDELEKEIADSEEIIKSFDVAIKCMEEKIKPEPFVEYMQSSNWGNEKRYD